MEVSRQLHPTSWLTRKLGVSIGTVERLRVQDSDDMPPLIQIGRSIRYDNQVIEALLNKRQQGI